MDFIDFVDLNDQSSLSLVFEDEKINPDNQDEKKKFIIEYDHDTTERYRVMRKRKLDPIFQI